MLKSVASSLITASILGLAGLGYAQPATYRTLAPWIFGIVTVGIWGGLGCWVGYCVIGKTFRMQELNESSKTMVTLAVAWVLITLFMVALWYLPHILPQVPAKKP